MSNAKPMTNEKRIENYTKQTGKETLTPAQSKQIRKATTRYGHEQQRSVHRETKRNRRQRFREWMAGMR